MRQRIVAVTPNPAIDKTMLVPGFSLGHIHRPERLIALAGGKGLNVARVVKRLGGDSYACVLLAGHSGRWLADQLDREGIGAGIAWSEGETRTCFSILDPHTGSMTEVYEAGEPVSQSQWEAFETMVDQSLATAALATFSGSLPPGAPSDGYARLLRIAQGRSVSVFVDTRGEALRHALDAKPALIKVNALEASDVAGRAIHSTADAVVAAGSLCERSRSVVIITLGAQGAIAVDGQEAWHAVAPVQDVMSAVGSGDAFLGGFAVATLRGAATADALRLAVSVATANTFALGAGMFDPSSAVEVSKQVRILRWES